MDMGRDLESADPNLSFSLYSRFPFPFPWNADRKLDSFELASLRAFERGGERAVEEAIGANGTTIIRTHPARTTDGSEDLVDAPHRLDGHRRPHGLGEIGQLEEPGTAVGPA